MFELGRASIAQGRVFAASVVEDFNVVKGVTANSGLIENDSATNTGVFVSLPLLPRESLKTLYRFNHRTFSACRLKIPVRLNAHGF